MNNRILIYEDTNAINNAKDGLKEILPLLQEFSVILKEICEHSPESFDREDMNKLFHPTWVQLENNSGMTELKQESPFERAVKSIVFDKLTKDEDGSFYGNLKINKQAALNLVEFPNYSELIPIAETIDYVFKQRTIDPDWLEISKNGKVNIAGDAYEKIEEMYRVYAETPEEKKRLKAAKQIADGILQLAEMNCLTGKGIEIFSIPGMFDARVLYPNEKKVDINPHWIKTGQPA